MLQLWLSMLLSPILSVLCLFENKDVFIHDASGLLYQSLLVIPYIIYQFIWNGVMTMQDDEFILFVIAVAHSLCVVVYKTFFGQPFDI